MDAKTAFITKPVARLPFPHRVDIIIPFYGQYEKVTKLLESIFRFTMSNVYQIILVDDCSPNRAFSDSLSKVPGVVTVRTEKQIGFGGALGVGFQKSQELDAKRQSNKKPSHPFVLFMQSDCVVEDVNWLKSMGESLFGLKEEGVRMISPRTNSPMGGDQRQKGTKALSENDVVEDVVLENTHLSLYCSLCHRSLFRLIGGFIKDYPYGYFEDEELAYRMRKYGYKQAIAGASWIKHIGQATIRELWRINQESRKIMTEENRQRCIKDIRALDKQRMTMGEKISYISESKLIDNM